MIAGELLGASTPDKIGAAVTNIGYVSPALLDKGDGNCTGCLGDCRRANHVVVNRGVGGLHCLGQNPVWICQWDCLAVAQDLVGRDPAGCSSCLGSTHAVGYQ
jgi:hypothetical protein